MADDPVFIPLQAKWFAAFIDGSKTDELRLYGPRWNERVCRVGRPVVLSKGYGLTYRAQGVIRSFARKPAASLSEDYRRALLETYGRLDGDIAVIGIANVKPVANETVSPNVFLRRPPLPAGFRRGARSDGDVTCARCFERGGHTDTVQPIPDGEPVFYRLAPVEFEEWIPHCSVCALELAQATSTKKAPS